MRKILYNMHFRSQTSPVVDHSDMVRTTGSATGCVVRTTIRSSGVQADLQPADGDLAFFESELRVTGPDGFQEDGTITIGEDSEHLLRFSTVGEGHLIADVEPGMLAGTASWRVDGGEGQFAAARGFINSTFTISDRGERSDFHCGLIFLPE
jgi:hypothetical protein